MWGRHQLQRWAIRGVFVVGAAASVATPPPQEVVRVTNFQNLSLVVEDTPATIDVAVRFKPQGGDRLQLSVQLTAAEQDENGDVSFTVTGPFDEEAAVVDEDGGRRNIRVERSTRRSR